MNIENTELMITRFLWLLTFVFCSSLGTAKAQNLDSLEQALPQMEPTIEKFKAITDLAWAYSRANPQRAIAFTEQALQLAKDHLGEEQEILAYYYFGTAHKNLGNHQQALDYFEPYSAYFAAQNDQRKVCFVKYQTGVTKSLMGNFAGAIEDLYVNIRIARELGYKDTGANTLSVIATIYRKMKDYTKSIEKNLEAYALFEALGDQNGMGMVLANNANTYAIQGQYAQAMQGFSDALLLFISTGDEYMLENVYANLGMDTGPDHHRVAGCGH
jgi:tetratricopeptide (TPR) repeat protein